MNLIICGILSLAAFAASVIAAVLMRHNLRKAVRALSAGFFITIFLAIAPCNIDGGRYSFGVNLFETICVMITQSNLNDTLAAVSLYDSPVAGVYRVYIILLYVIGPFSIAGATLSFVKGFGSLIYSVKSIAAESYIFSAANERSIAVCKSVRKAHPKALIAFAVSGTDLDESVLQQIEELDGIVLRKSAKDVKHGLRHKRHYYLLDKNAANNIEQGLAINGKYKNNKAAAEKAEILIYSTDETSQIIFYNTAHNVTIRLFREEEIIANDLIFNYPLYGGVLNGRLDILLVGGGKIGFEILKKIIWAGRLGERIETRINVVDEKASGVEARLKKECPALFDECGIDIGFYNADVKGGGFTEVIDKTGTPTYIVVALGNEKINAETCIYLRRHFGLTDGFPKLHMTTDSEDFAEKLKLLNVYDWTTGENRTFCKRADTVQNFEIKGFGSYENAYGQLNPDETTFGRLALACHFAKLEPDWDGKKSYLNPGEKPEQFLNSLSYSYSQIAFCKNNADQLALSIGYLLYSLGYTEKCGEYLERVRAELGLSSVNDIPLALYVAPEYDFKRDLQDNIEKISDLVTERFDRFMYTQGWTNLPVSEIKNKSVRDQLRLKYARIGNYDADELEKLMSGGETQRKNYRKNDTDEILKLPEILKVFEEISAVRIKEDAK